MYRLEVKQIFRLLIIGFFVFQKIYGQEQLAQKEITSQIDALFSKYNRWTPGVSVAIIKDGSTVFKKGYGMANLEYDIPITSKTVFHIASVSKQFTTFAIYLLENKGKISLEDDIRKYLPEVPDFGKPITIKHLCYHTSGLKDQWALLTLAGWRMDDVITTSQILKLINKQKELNFNPGSQFKYSNTGFTLLAKIVERVSGKTFAEFTRENIFMPLGMNNTQFYDDYEKIVKNRAYSYVKQNDVYRKKKLNYSTVGATSLFTTVEDLSKWVLNFEKPIVGTSKLIEKFNQQAVLDNGKPAILGVIDDETIYHAKGQFFRNYRGVKLYNHTGGDAGFKTYLARFPNKKLSIIVLGNEQSFQPLPTGLEIAEFYLKNELKDKKENTKSDFLQNKAKGDNNEYASGWGEYVGSYISEELETTYIITIQNDKLIMQHKRLEDVELSQTGENTFSGTLIFPVELKFLRAENKSVMGFRISNFGAKNVKFHKIK